MPLPLHPDIVLHSGVGSSANEPLIPACEHYAGDEKKLRKALALQHDLRGAFDVTADLEDGAAAGTEAQMARLLAGILAEPRAVTYRVGCRVHPADHAAFASDVTILLEANPPGLAYITLPKISGRGQLDQAIAWIAQECHRLGRPSVPDVQVLIEDEAALHEVFQIAEHPHVKFIAFGQMDFTSSHHGAIPATAMKSPGQFDHPLMRRAKCEIAAACHAHGKIATHNPTTDYASATQAAADAQRAKDEFGFTRMWSIHPNQVSQILSVFTPSVAQIADASRILLAAQAADWGPIADQGLLHDRASYRYFWTVLQQAHAAGRPIPESAERAFFQT